MDLTSDPAHCGVCNHSCGDALGCLYGGCVLTNETVQGMARDAGYLYWSIDESPPAIYRMALGGGPLAAIGSPPVAGEIAVDDVNVYSTTESTNPAGVAVMAMPKSGGAFTAVSSDDLRDAPRH